MLEHRFTPPRPIDVVRTLGPTLRRPTGLVRDGAVWRATRTPAGPATVQARSVGRDVVVRAWGPGAEAAIDAAPATVGAGDDDHAFDTAGHPLVDRLHRVAPGLRIPRTGAVFEALVPAILEQKVQGGQARRSYRGLTWRLGEPAPGPAAAMLGLRLLPHPDDLARVPAHTFHTLNVERKRAVTLVTAARYAARLEACAHLPPADGRRLLQTLPGIGPWTAAEVAVVAFGDTDAVSVGDYHLPDTIAWALAGEPRADDERMLELLAPWAGQRARVVKLIEGAGIAAPRYGPRLALHDIRAL